MRSKILGVVRKSGCGHIGSAFSIVEILKVLFDEFLYPGTRFILSKGHGCLALYVQLADSGLIPEDWLDRFCKFEGELGGHPEAHIPGVHVATGALGHGLSIGVGMALVRKQRVYVLLGDGECEEGSVWEAALCASRHMLNNLTVLVDYNKRQAYGLTKLEPLADKWKAFGFDVVWCDGHNPVDLKLAISTVHSSKPVCVICHTVKGKGLDLSQDWHYRSGLKPEQVDELARNLS